MVLYSFYEVLQFFIRFVQDRGATFLSYVPVGFCEGRGSFDPPPKKENLDGLRPRM
jgi:hypothetical protein